MNNVWAQVADNLAQLRARALRPNRIDSHCRLGYQRRVINIAVASLKGKHLHATVFQHALFIANGCIFATRSRGAVVVVYEEHSHKSIVNADPLSVFLLWA